jgi:anaerobic ribonucleoside-triphosphate reductase
MKNINSFLTERKRQDVCEGCGKSIEDPEKECPTCGKFPHKAYHERSAAKTLGISKWLQNSTEVQPNQKLAENIILRISEFPE